MKRWLKLMLCISSLLLSSCSVGNQYYCPPIPAYDLTGKLDPENYRVNRICYKHMTQKLKACYRDAE